LYRERKKYATRDLLQKLEQKLLHVSLLPEFNEQNAYDFDFKGAAGFLLAIFDAAGVSQIARGWRLLCQRQTHHP
jgi:hypothetical protein